MSQERFAVRARLAFLLLAYILPQAAWQLGDRMEAAGGRVTREPEAGESSLNKIGVDDTQNFLIA